MPESKLLRFYTDDDDDYKMKIVIEPKSKKYDRIKSEFPLDSGNIATIIDEDEKIFLTVQTESGERTINIKDKTYRSWIQIPDHLRYDEDSLRREAENIINKIKKEKMELY